MSDYESNPSKNGSFESIEFLNREAAARIAAALTAHGLLLYAAVGVMRATMNGAIHTWDVAVIPGTGIVYNAPEFRKIMATAANHCKDDWNIQVELTERGKNQLPI